MTEKKRVLIITYYWPPGTGAGVFRWLKFSKYLRDYGWEPVVYTPENPEAQGTDHTLEEDIPEGMTIIRRPIREPYGIYKALTGRRKEEKIQSGFLSEGRKPGRADKAAAWIRGNFFIPDARKYWIRPSVTFLAQWLKENPVDAIVSTGPPHSMHMIALELKKQTGLPWLADFRDPWIQIDFYDKLMLTGMADKKHRKLEKQVLQAADSIITVSRGCAIGLEEIAQKPVDVISNGFDPNDFRKLPPFSHNRFSLTHMGSMNADRNHEVLWQVLSRLRDNLASFPHDLRLRFIGKTDFSVKEHLKKYNLLSHSEFIAPLPHKKALEKAADSAVLLLPLNNTPNAAGITTGKLFEYLGLQRPILCIGPPGGDAAHIIRETQSGHNVDFDDQEGLKDILLSWYELFLKGKLQANATDTEKYSRTRQTEQLVSLLDHRQEKTQVPCDPP